jgi:hypothetical protein
MNKTLIGYLQYEARVKPHIKELVDRVDDMTDEDIEAAQVPLPWFRIALRDLRDSRKVVELPEIPHEADPMGTLVEWVSAEAFIKTTARLEVEVKPGMLLWLAAYGLNQLSVKRLTRKYMDSEQLVASPKASICFDTNNVCKD